MWRTWKVLGGFLLLVALAGSGRTEKGGGGGQERQPPKVHSKVRAAREAEAKTRGESNHAQLRLRSTNGWLHPFKKMRLRREAADASYREAENRLRLHDAEYLHGGMDD